MLRQIAFLLVLLGAASVGGSARADIRPPGSAKPPMMFSGVHPSPAAPGEQVTIKGMQFMPGARVWLGDVEATDVEVHMDGHSLVATVPEHKPGKVSVMIRNPDGREVSRGLSFAYRKP
jgi:hypothetical protein